MSEPNVVKKDGVPLFLNTVVGIEDESQNVITVGSMSELWTSRLEQPYSTIDRQEAAFEKLADKAETLCNELVHLWPRREDWPSDELYNAWLVLRLEAVPA
ncbi:hypothetical protein G3V96_27560 [Escherichia coli]|nr:hypothetical protein [Escherichia coli]